MKICFLGSHGTGKSSSSAYLASLLKRRFPEKSVIVLEENVRKVSRMLGTINTPEFQKLAIVDQISREIEAESIHDIVICDRATLDPVVYGSVLSTIPDVAYTDLAMDNMLTYDHVFFVRPDSYHQTVVNDGFRMMNMDIRNKVDHEFNNWLIRELKLTYTTIHTSNVFTYDYLKHFEDNK